MPVTYKNVTEAHSRIQNWLHRTPVLTNAYLDDLSGATLLFKCENFQKTGSFKARGALNAILKLDDETVQNGVATHSSGNHAAAVARSASIRGIPAYIVMPENAPRVKIDAVRFYGGVITFCEPTLQAREDGLEDVIRKHGPVFVPPYNHEDVIAGQGTAAKELIDDHPDLDIVMAPVGGGGLLSGTAVSSRHLLNEALIYGAEPKEADDAYRSFKAQKLIPLKSTTTIADGLRTSLGDKTFAYIIKYVDDIFTVEEDEIIRAMRLIWERMKIIVEPSCAVPLAVVLARPEKFRGKKTGIILSGGNVDLGKLPF